jgi:hypothetical protein
MIEDLSSLPQFLKKSPTAGHFPENFLSGTVKGIQRLSRTDPSLTTAKRDLYFQFKSC